MSSQNKIDLEELNKRLHDILPMPQILAKILKAVNDPQTSAANVEQIFKYEPSFTLKLMTLANSAYYGSPGKVSNIRAAITVLGFNMIKSLAIHASVNEFFNFGTNTSMFSGYDLWKHSVGVGLCAKMISRRLRLGNAEDFFTMGILHDMGLIIEYQFYREPFLQVLTELKDQGGHITDIEKNVMGTNHAELAAMICQKWNMPEELGLLLKYHHSPLEVPDALKPAACVLCAANVITKKNRYGFYYPSQEEVMPEAMAILGIEKIDMEVLGEDFVQETQEMSMMLE